MTKMQDEYMPSDVPTLHADAQAVMEHFSTADACCEASQKMKQELIRHRSMTDETPKVTEDLINADSRLVGSCLGEGLLGRRMHAEAKEARNTAFEKHWGS